MHGPSPTDCVLPSGCSNQNMVYVNKSLQMPFPKIINFDLLLVSFAVKFCSVYVRDDKDFLFLTF